MKIDFALGKLRVSGAPKGGAPCRIDGDSVSLGDSSIRVCEGGVELSTDPAGCFPLYFRKVEGGVRVSDQVSELGGTLDPVGAIEHLRFGYGVGARTPFREVSRVRPGEVVRITDRVVREDRSRLWATEERGSQLEVFCELLTGAFPADVTLMMSGGWDSRLLLAAALAAGTKPRLYFHGDTESREANLVRRMAESEGLEVTFAEITPEMFEPERLEGFFGHFECMSFPYWHAVRERGEGPVSAGIFGEVVGGHYGPPAVLTGRAKAVESLKWLLGFAGGSVNGKDAAAQLYRQRPYNCPWYVKREAWESSFRDVHETVNADIEGELDRYERRGIEKAHTFVEAFVTEHRGSQFIAGQLHSAAPAGGFVAPLGRPDLMEIAASIPFSQKAFNRFTQAAIKRLWPSLLDHPIAATLCSAKRPVQVLEASRAARKAGERFSKRRLSWVNFSGVLSSGVVNRLVDSLRNEMWDKDRMRDVLSSTPVEQSHQATDMILKIKNLDMLVA